MPGRLFFTRPVSELAQALNQSPNSDIEFNPSRNISPGEQIVSLSANGLSLMRWGMIPVGRKNARGRPVMETIINARSETVFDKSAFQGVQRAVIPVEGWYEWTGEKRKKTAWEIKSKRGDLLFFAAIFDIWKGPGGIEVPQVATVTCEPNDDLREIHHRMAVILNQKDISLWLYGDEAQARDLMEPWPNGLLEISTADPAWFI